LLCDSNDNSCRNIYMMMTNSKECAVLDVRKGSLCICCGDVGKIYLKHPDFPVMFKCTSCGLYFVDPQAFANETEHTYGKDLNDYTEEEKKHFKKIFSEVIATSDSGGNMYSDFGISQQQMEKEIFASVDTLIKQYRKITKETVWTILDVGCATGFLLNVIRCNYPSVIISGVEPSPDSCAKAQALYGIKLFQGTMNTFCAEEKSYDVITIMGNLQLHADPFLTLRKCRRILKEKGLLIFQMKNPSSLARVFTILLSKLPILSRWRITKLAIERGFSCMRYALGKDDLRRMTEELGLDVLEITTLPPRMLAFGNTRRGHRRGLIGLAWQILDRIDQWRDQQAWIQVCACRSEDSELRNRT